MVAVEFKAIFPNLDKSAMLAYFRPQTMDIIHDIAEILEILLQEKYWYRMI